jgi:hypothetical protein
MPTVENPNLILSTLNNTTTIRVTYNARFTPFERQLAGLGMRWHEHINVFGMDASSETHLLDTEPPLFPRANLAVTVGAGDQVIARDVSQPVTRTSLNEDAAAGDDDEILCRIKIHTEDVPQDFSAELSTPQRSLPSN